MPVASENLKYSKEFTYRLGYTTQQYIYSLLKLKRQAYLYIFIQWTWIFVGVYRGSAEHHATPPPHPPPADSYWPPQSEISPYVYAADRCCSQRSLFMLILLVKAPVGLTQCYTDISQRPKTLTHARTHRHDHVAWLLMSQAATSLPPSAASVIFSG